MQAEIATAIGNPGSAQVNAVAEVKDNDGIITTHEVKFKAAVPASGGIFWLTPKGYGPSGKSVFDYFPNA